MPTEAVQPITSASITHLALCVALTILLIIGGLLLFKGLALRSECRQAESAQVLDLPINLSATGQQRTTFTQPTCFPCRQYFKLLCTVSSGGDSVTRFDGLELTLSIKDSTGFEHLAATYPSLLPQIDAANGLMLADDRPLPVGDYTVTVDVVSPATALAGQPIRLTSGYLLCGIEWMPPLLFNTLGTACVAAGTLIAFALMRMHRRSRSHIPRSTTDHQL